MLLYRRLNLLIGTLIFILVIPLLYYRNNSIKCGAQSNVLLDPGSIIVYNRIPKTGSTTLTNAVAYDLCEMNAFHVVHVNLTRNRYVMSVADQGEFVRNVSAWRNVAPAFYHGHFAYVDFTRFGYPNPIYINLVREPFERFLSYYYFLRYGDNYRVGLKRRKAGNNETFDECLERGGHDCDLKQFWLQIPYFCGTANYCSEVGNERALETAKRHLTERYLLVGVTERIADAVAVLERVAPAFFRNADAHFRELNERRAHLRHTQKKFPPTSATVKRVRNNVIYRMERELYDFAVREFDALFRRIFNAPNRAAQPQFHYEKIKPALG